MSDSHFDAIAREYDESLPAHVVEHYLRKRTAFVIDHCPPPAAALDVGCGTGVLAERLAAAGFDMAGVDPSAGMLEILSRRAPGVRAQVGSGTELPFDDASFDLVMSVAVMHHVADPVAVRQVLGEMVRVVRPGGRVLHWDHNPRNPYWGRLMAKVPQDTGEERLVGEQEVRSGLHAAGAQILLSTQLGLVPDFVPARAMGIAARAESLVERTPLVRRLGAHNVILATKPAARTSVPRPRTAPASAGSPPAGSSPADA